MASGWIETPVTNARFRAFVEATGHVTVAERPPRAEDYPGAPPEMLRPGSLVFVKPPGPVDLRDIRNGGNSCSAPTGAIPWARRVI